MNFELIWADAALRGAAASLLVLHMLLAVGNGLRLPLRGVLAAFVMSILAYLWCSHPAFRTLSNPWWAIILSFCLMSAPLLWLLVRQVFDDGFQWTPAIWVGQALVLAAGWLAVLNVGGQVASHVASVAHKCLLIGFALATLWTTLRDWQSDLVATRRLLRTWLTGILGAYVLIVLIFELVFDRTAPPPWLMTLHLVGIVILSAWTALLFARNPVQDWLVRVAPGEVDAAPSDFKSRGYPKEDFPPTHEAATPDATVHLTPPSPELDRKARLRERLLQTMGKERTYAQEGLTLSQLAGRLDTSPVQLRQAIHEGLGYRNFNDFLHHYRVDEAAHRLRSQDLPVLSIALDVGYASIGPFNRAFKHLKGVTPSEWRSQNRPISLKP